MKKIYYIAIFFIVSFPSLYAQNLSVSFEKLERSCILGEATITIINGSQPIQIVWSTGSISNSIGQLEKGDYSVTITDNLSNDTTINFSIEELICEPIPENNFTPNGDGYNDTWNISRIEYFPNFDLYVYNRWGQLVHRQSGTFTPWDASSILLPLPDATYYYVLYLDKSNKKDFIKGDVSILR